MDQKFKQAVALVLKHEGGYVFDPDDPGGETKFGISKRSYPDLEIKVLTVDRAIEIYHRDWWEKYRYGEIENNSIAAKIFDLAVNMGPKKAHMILQQASNYSGGKLLDVDGAIGDLTIRAINKHKNAKWLFTEIRMLAIEFYVGLGKDKYLRGWIRRALDEPK